MVASLDDLWRVIVQADPNAVCSSGFRCPTYNRTIGGTGNSLHQYGCAIDVTSYFKGFQALKKNPLVRIIDEGDHFHIEWVL